jgi:hypothetical protein
MSLRNTILFLSTAPEIWAANKVQAKTTAIDILLVMGLLLVVIMGWT